MNVIPRGGEFAKKKIACGYSKCDRLIPPSFSLSFPPV